MGTRLALLNDQGVTIMNSIRKYQTPLFSFFALILLSGCKIDLFGIFPDPDPFLPPCAYSIDCGLPEPTPHYEAVDFSGKVEVVATSTLPFSSDQVAVYSGKCKAPSVSIYLATYSPVQQRSFHRIELSFSSLPELMHDYNFPDLTSSSPIQLNVLGTSIYLKRGVISFQEAPEKLALGGRIKFTGHFVANDNKVLDIKFDGVVPVPETTDVSEIKANPYRCEEEVNANGNFERELTVASQCTQSSDCVSSYLILFESCSGIAINKNATNFDDLEKAVEDYNSVFETNNACSINQSGALPTCEQGLCRAPNRVTYYW